MMLDEDCNIVAKDKLTDPNGKEVFEIGSGSKSCTGMPTYYQQQNVYFVDCPGQEDQNRTKEFLNQSSVHYVQKNAKASIILLVISPDQFVNRGVVFVRQITCILRQIKTPCDKVSLSKMLMPLIVKYKVAKMPKKIVKDINTVIEALDMKFTQMDTNYENIFQGPEFPQENEAPYVKLLCEFVRDNYVCIDPLDQSV